MTDIFKNIPQNFFTLLSGELRNEYAACLSLIFEELEETYEYTLDREEVVEIIISYLKSNDLEGDKGNRSYREKAATFIRIFKDRGWLSEGHASDFRIVLSFTEQALEFMHFIRNLGQGSELEYSSQIFSIYNSFKTFDLSKGELIIESAHVETTEFIGNLKKLNTTIKKYIQKILNDNIKNDIQSILDVLTSEYQMKIVDVAYYHLLTRDHPSQYSSTIIHKIDDLLNDDIAMTQMAENMSQSIDVEEGKRLLKTKLDYIQDQFNNISDLLHEITLKNQAFVSSAIGRIRFLLNESSDINGHINTLIKKMETMDDLSLDNVFLDLNVLADYSLATPRKRLIKEDSYIQPALVNDSNSDDLIQSLLEMSKYSMNRINEIVIELLEGKDQISASSLRLKDRATVFLIYVYGLSNTKDAQYKVEQVDKRFLHSGMSIQEFIIRRVNHE